jgi:hypothetical protein
MLFNDMPKPDTDGGVVDDAASMPADDTAADDTTEDTGETM